MARQFWFTDQPQKPDQLFVDRWADAHDKTGQAIYENDYVIFYYDGTIRWASGIVTRRPKIGACILTNFGGGRLLERYWFADCYIESNVYKGTLAAVKTEVLRLNMGLQQEISYKNTSRAGVSSWSHRTSA